jgi:hypothetical protein
LDFSQITTYQNPNAFQVQSYQAQKNFISFSNVIKNFFLLIDHFKLIYFINFFNLKLSQVQPNILVSNN